jgi:serine phosphatase RsbU (regulator of sigma subunit)
MRSIPNPAAGKFFETYTRDLTSTEFQRLFTREAVDAYRFFARGVDTDALSRLPWHKRAIEHIRLLFLAFTLRLSPARRALYGIALAATVLGLLQLFRGFEVAAFGVPVPAWRAGAIPLLVGVLLMNLLVLLEVADRLSLKNDLDIAREIQQAMLPCGVYRTHDCEAYGQTRPANTVGGDFYEILPLEDGRVVVALGDVAGKGSPAALLMALLLAMLRTLLDEGLEERQLIERLNVQICKHAPRSRFITLFFGVYDPATGRLVYINAGQNPPFIRRRTGEHVPLSTGGIALGMFEGSRYEKGLATVEPGEVLVMYSDGITEAESRSGVPFDEAGLERVVDMYAHTRPTDIAAAVFEAVASHADASRFADDLTLVVVRRAWPTPAESLPPLPSLVKERV